MAKGAKKPRASKLDALKKQFATQAEKLGKLSQGRDQFASNILSGRFADHRVIVFDFRYTTGSGKEQQHHYLTIFILILEGCAFPRLIIGPENLLMKVAQAFGFEDIDFESAEFSRKFCVQSKDKRFAYDICNAQMIEYLLENQDLEIEIFGPALSLSFDGQLSAGEIEPNLGRLCELRSRFPEYLFANQPRA